MIAKFSVKKPYTIIVGVILVVVLGIVSFTRMTTDLLPDMSLPYALIITTDIGASPEEIETDVTAPIEAAMATTSNIKSVSSGSYDNYSMVILEYEQSSNMDSVLIEIQQELDQLAGGWPDTVGAPMIMQIDPDMMPVMVASVDVEGMDQGEISIYVENELVPALESVEGIASVSTTGALEENIQVTMDQEKIDALNERIQEKIAEQFAEAQAELDDASAQIQKGKEELEKGQSQLEDQVASAQNEVVNGKIQALVGESDLNMSLTLLTQVKSLLEGAIPMLQSYYDEGKALQEQLAALSLTQSPEQTEEILRLKAQIAWLQSNIQAQMESMGAGIPQNAGQTTLPESGMTGDWQVQPIEGHGELAELQAQMALLTEQLENLQGAQSQTSEQSQEIQSRLTEILNQIAGQNEQLGEFGINIQGIDDIPQAIAVLTQALAEVNTSIATMQAAQTQIDEGKSTLDDVLVTLNKSQIAGILQMSEAAAKLADGESQLALGQAQIDEAKKTAEEAADLNNILTAEMLGNLLVAQNFSMPAGYVTEGDNQYIVKVGDKLSSMEELKSVVLLDVGMEGIEPIRLSDIAEVKMADNSAESYSKVDGNPAIMLSIEKQTGYSTGDVTKRAKAKFEALEQEYENLNMTVMMNQGVYIDIIVQSVLENMILGAILAVIVLIVFLKDFKPTMVIACSIPLSVIFAIVLMYFTNISLNIISLSGLALGIGMLVDNSIVVIENIYRLRSEGYSIRKAAVEGTSQVTGAIIASTLTTVCVFAPIIFTEGITRQLFVDIALTIAYTLTASLVVALTFVPMMAAGVLKSTKEAKHELYDKILGIYEKILEQALRFKPLVLIVVVVLLVVSAVAAYSQGFTFMDMEMEADQLTVTVSAKEDEILEFEELTALADEVVGRISGIEGIETVGAMIGGGGTMMMGGGSSDAVTMYLILEEDTEVSNDEIAAQVKELTKDMDCQVNADSSASDMTALLGSGLTVQIKGRDLDKLQEIAKEVAKVVEEEEGTVDVNDGLDNTTPSFTIHVDKEKAAKYGMTTAQVFQLVYAKTASSTSPTAISTDLKDYAVYVKTPEQAGVTLDDIRNITFTYKDRMGEEEEIALKDIVTFETGSSLSTINRSSQTRYISVTAGIDADHNVTLVSNSLMEKLEKLDLPEGYEIAMTGEDEMINEAMEQLYLMLILAIVFIYLIMVAQFQSFLSPFIIMFTIPLAFTGGLFALYFTGNEISVVAMIGFIMLAGIIVNNGIVMVDYINQLRQEGMSKKEAIIESGVTRLRPILMTALTTILSMSTMALGLGEGSEMMQPMAIVTVGGLVYGTLLTLIVVPCIYDAFNREKSMVEEEL